MRQNTWLRDLGLAVLLCGGFLLFAHRVIPFFFAVNDDTTMISILNGSYSGTPDGHAIFIGYPLGWLISRLYATGMMICWYKWVLMGCVLFGLASVLYRLYRRFPEHLMLSSALVLGLFSFLWLAQVMRATFTTCGAFVMACTILSYGIQPKEQDLHPGYLANILLLLFLSYELRDYFGFLTIPFLGVLWLGKYWGELRKNKACWLIPLSGLMCFALAAGAERIAYSGSWAEFITYNDARSYLQDYGNFPDYDEHEDFFRELGLTREAYRTVSRYDYCLLEDFQPEKLMAIYDYAKTLEPEESLRQIASKAIHRTTESYFISDLSSLTPLRFASYAAPAVLLLCAVVLSLREGKQLWGIPLLLLFGIACCWLLVGYQGRTPDRVVLSLRLLTVSASLAGCAFLFSRSPVIIPNRRLKQTLSLLLCCLMVVLCAWGGLQTRRAQRGHSAPQTEYLLYAAQHPDDLFIREIKSTVSGGSDKLLEFPRAPVNMLSSGGWSVYSPVYRQKLDTLGIDAVNRSLLLEDNVYLLVNLDAYDLNKVLGVRADAQISYDVVEVFDGDLSMLSIHSITEP